MTHRIGKRFTFDAAHHLDGLPDGHKCGRRHGHTYTVEVTIVGGLDPGGPGFVVDFGDLTPLKTYIDAELDHRYLNDVVPVSPTSERLAAHIYWWCREHLPLPASAVIEAVRVSETPSTWAEYRP